MTTVWIPFLLLSLALRSFEVSLPQMGTTFHSVLYGTDADAGSRAATAAFQRVEQLEDIFSDDSESRRLRTVPPSSAPDPAPAARRFE